jgi:hypothetical protein
MLERLRKAAVIFSPQLSRSTSEAIGKPLAMKSPQSRIRRADQDAREAAISDAYIGSLGQLAFLLLHAPTLVRREGHLATANNPLVADTPNLRHRLFHIALAGFCLSPDQRPSSSRARSFWRAPSALEARESA